MRRFGAVVAVSVREWAGMRGGVGGGGGVDRESVWKGNLEMMKGGP